MVAADTPVMAPAWLRAPVRHRGFRPCVSSVTGRAPGGITGPSQLFVPCVSHLFEPIKLRDLVVSNRAWVSPMCQYSAEDGLPNDWHLVHLGQFATGGAGLIVTEATAVVPEGRISPGDTGLWNDEQTEAWRRINDFLHQQGAATAIQLAHAGRKASTTAMWEGGASVPPEEGGWQTVS